MMDMTRSVSKHALQKVLFYLTGFKMSRSEIMEALSKPSNIPTYAFVRAIAYLINDLPDEKKAKLLENSEQTWLTYPEKRTITVA